MEMPANSETNPAAADPSPTTSKAGMHDVVDKAAASMGHAALSALPAIDVAAQSMHKGVDYVADAVAPSAEWVRQHPLQALGVAFATGYLLGRIGR